ncbi:hypothetical protein [Shewanella sp. KJ2020]|jgi:t-SNARE complex subunit (syntaxin)|uniref:hypothetical protein n=1 Tax=Shewanella sp. KJ2020 TaxID=2919172 RepID=UPI0020A6EE89|nr:hypothetical protein [Shewanella sp. KJ2020]MCP3130062.1 hypothetical protein [Shewanella sp. KJ2020]
MSSIVTTELFLKILPTFLVAGGAAIGMEYLKVKLERKIKEKRGETTSERIERLSKALKESISLTNEIEQEIQKRHSMVTKLQDDVNRYESLAKLKESEVEAIAQTLRGELRSEGSKSLLKSALISLVFFVAGVIVTLYAA